MPDENVDKSKLPQTRTEGSSLQEGTTKTALKYLKKLALAPQCSLCRSVDHLEMLVILRRNRQIPIGQLPLESL